MRDGSSTQQRQSFGRPGLWPTFTAQGPRGDADPATPATPPAEPAAVDLTNPAIQAALREAAQKAVSTREAEWVRERDAILAKEKEILDEKKKLQEALGGGKPEEISARLKKLDEIEAREKAGQHGKSGDDWLKAVEEEAQKKHQVWRTEQTALMEKDRTRISELAAENENLKKAEHRAWVSYRVALAAMPPDHRYIQEGAEDMLMDRLVGVMERFEADGVPATARFKVGGTLLTGTGPGGYMTEREFLDLARAGKVPGMPQLQFLFVSNGQGSDTKTPEAAAAAAAGGNWWKMTQEARTEYVNKHGGKAARELMDRSPKEKAA